MKILLTHNKIIADTATKSFIASVEGELLEKLVAKYGDSLEEIQLYEDYLADGFLRDGEFYYPLTVVLDGAPTRQWVKWNISEKKKFKGQNPFAYLSSETLEISLCDGVPAEFSTKLLGRASYFEEGLVPLTVDVNVPDSNLLVGKYSQTFVDELTRQLHAEIMRKCSVTGLSDSGVSLTLSFAPDTYMEHIVENTTYRRLSIKARGCNARDLWIKWTRLNSMTPFSVSDNVFATDVRFEIAEDVPQNIREREYRYLRTADAETYQASMQRKNITEWRELIKRCVKRGELIKCESEEKADAEPKNELEAKLQEVLGAYTQTVEKATEDTVDDSDLTSLLKGILGTSEASPKEPEAAVGEAIEEAVEEVAAEEDIEDTPEDVPFDLEPAEFFETPVEEEPTEEEISEQITVELIEEPVEELQEVSVADESELRARLEAEIREKLLLEMREKAEAEKTELLLVQEKLRLENERLLEIARRAEEEKAAKEAKEREAAEKLKLEAEARAIAEAKEREKIEEAARAALLEEQRLAERRAAEEAIAAERARLEEERARLEAERLERERAAEAARATEAKEEKPASPRYTYVSKNARLLFRMQIDPNITKRIHEIILATIKYFHKEDIFIKIKATIPDSTTVNLHFEKIPEEENELLINIIKVLGKSDLGITKVFLE